MKIVKLLIATAIAAILLSPCRSAPCAGYGDMHSELLNNNQKVEQQV